MSRQIIKNESKMDFIENEKVVASYDYSSNEWKGARGNISCRYAKTIIKRFVSDKETWISKFIGTDSWSMKQPNMGNVMNQMGYLEFIYNAINVYSTKDMEIDILADCAYKVYREVLDNTDIRNGDEIAKILNVCVDVFGNSVYRGDVTRLIDVLTKYSNIISVDNTEEIKKFMKFIAYIRTIFIDDHDSHITKSNFNKYKKMVKLTETDLSILCIGPAQIIRGSLIANAKKFGLEKSLNIFPSTIDDIVRLSKLNQDIDELVKNRENSILLNDDEIMFITDQFNSVLDGTYKVIEVLASKNQYVKEGALMNNCIGSYYKRLDDGGAICLVIDDESNKNRTDVCIERDGDYVKIYDMRRSRNVSTGLMNSGLVTRFAANADHKRFIEILNRVGGIN